MLSLAITLIASSGILSNVTMASEVENFTEEEVKEVDRTSQSEL